ncbi:hypothetical protein VZT92_003529 [Zoarces viviparus]|uniref:Uncharacterized protein n=1 Tax=Zoarces viviparus TaxID=48416 RepID=A0AAW1FUF7_ZOAVI
MSRWASVRSAVTQSLITKASNDLFLLNDCVSGGAVGGCADCSWGLLRVGGVLTAASTRLTNSPTCRVSSLWDTPGGPTLLSGSARLRVQTLNRSPEKRKSSTSPPKHLSLLQANQPDGAAPYAAGELQTLQ